MSLIFFPMSIGFMSHVDFKKWPCRRVEFKGQGPQMLLAGESSSLFVGIAPLVIHCMRMAKEMHEKLIILSAEARFLIKMEKYLSA